MVLTLVTMLAFAVACYSFYVAANRMFTISMLPESVMNSEKKNKHTKKLRTDCLVFIGCMAVTVVFKVLPLGQVSLVGPIASILISAHFVFKIFEEIDEFNTTKKESEIMRDFLKNIDRDAKEKNK